MLLRRDENSASSPTLIFAKTRSSSKGGSTVVQDGDNTGAIMFFGGDGNDADALTAYILSSVDGTPGNNDMPGRLTFHTTLTEQQRQPSECVLTGISGRLLVGVTQSFANANADNLQVGNNSAAVESGISLGSTIGSGIRFGDAGNASAGIIEYFHTDNSLRLHTNATEQMRITSGGVMQMGDPSSSGSGGVRFSLPQTLAVPTSVAGNLCMRSPRQVHHKKIFQIFLGSTNKLLMRADGNLYNAAGGIGTLSDAKLKENIVDATSQWNDIEIADGIRKYNFKEETGHDTHTGLVLLLKKLNLYLLVLFTINLIKMRTATI